LFDLFIRDFFISKEVKGLVFFISATIFHALKTPAGVSRVGVASYAPKRW
jgi:hypothetical protein